MLITPTPLKRLLAGRGGGSFLNPQRPAAGIASQNQGFDRFPKARRFIFWSNKLASLLTAFSKHRYAPLRLSLYGKMNVSPWLCVKKKFPLKNTRFLIPRADKFHRGRARNGHSILRHKKELQVVVLNFRKGKGRWRLLQT